MSITKWGIAGLVIHTLGLGILVLFFINKNMVLFIWFSIFTYIMTFYFSLAIRGIIFNLKNYNLRRVFLLIERVFGTFILLFNAFILTILIVGHISKGSTFLSVTLLSLITIIMNLIHMFLYFSYYEHLEKKTTKFVYRPSKKDQYFLEKAVEIGTVLITIVLLGNSSFGLTLIAPNDPVVFIYTKEFWQFSVGYTIYSLFLYNSIQNMVKSLKDMSEDDDKHKNDVVA